MYKLVKKIRTTFLVYLTHGLALPMLKRFRKPEIFPYTESQLSQFYEGSLGKDLYLFLQKRNLPLLPYYARHDIKHIILGYDTTEEGEVCLQCFMLGNGHLSFPVSATFLYGLLTMPEHWTLFRKAFKRGRKCDSIQGWPWFEILSIPTMQLRSHIPTE